MKFLLALGLALAFATPVLASTESKTVRDWTGTCDEYACKAEVAGEGGLAMGQTGYILRIARAPGAGWMVSFVAHNVPKPADRGELQFMVPGADLPPSLVVKLDDDTFDLADQKALEKIFPALRKGTKLDIGFTSDDGADTESFSLSGLAAVLLWIDDKQKLVGKSTEVTAANLDNYPPELEGKAANDFMTKLQKLSPFGECDWSGGDPTQFHAATHDLGGGKTLYVVNCIAGAYQTGAMLLVDDGDSLTLLTFPQYSNNYGWSGTQEVVVDGFSSGDKELSTFAKFRGVGDCGAAAQYRWTGDGFALRQYVYKDCVDDSSANPDADWPVIYKAKE